MHLVFGIRLKHVCEYKLKDEPELFMNKTMKTNIDRQYYKAITSSIKLVSDLVLKKFQKPARFALAFDNYITAY